MAFQNITVRKINTGPVLAELAAAWKVTNQNPALKRLLESIIHEHLNSISDKVELRGGLKF
jgi:hypothetical protein